MAQPAQAMYGPLSIRSRKKRDIVKIWKLQWQYLFDQPRSQFVQMGFHFAQLSSYVQSLKTSQESLATADERTRYLTDHIYHIISRRPECFHRRAHLRNAAVKPP
ncbi:uncharacterized protein K460DRAFT_371624 [Cucurbitaria berberidis CBS 394.84]|uniref:Uncharacterized protein n=1 Tax=Cucurbitaria berberidis CBS 394.84 TaxID=1168544 RepID=A0A9P4G818_9PLEO|nr:uncharacterized protein K460DRAFT_371624 [Cucurbitaria berberidis CBS 394.84]KAF1840430.1 hypothetical protein K460DRAFT_371624 [Cucurbitaria berberidis CBS 394.84]